MLKEKEFEKHQYKPLGGHGVFYEEGIPSPWLIIWIAVELFVFFILLGLLG